MFLCYSEFFILYLFCLEMILREIGSKVLIKKCLMEPGESITTWKVHCALSTKPLPIRSVYVIQCARNGHWFVLTLHTKLVLMTNQGNACLRGGFGGGRASQLSKNGNNFWRYWKLLILWSFRAMIRFESEYSFTIKNIRFSVRVLKYTI